MSMDVPPRMRDMLAACDQARDELRAEFAAMRLFITTLLNSVARVPEVVEASSTLSPILGALDSIATRLDQLRQHECPAFPAMPSIHLNTTDYLSTVLSFLNLWHSETASCVVISYAWRCHVGGHRWALLLLAFLCSPKVTLLWVGLVVISRAFRAVHDMLSWVRGTALFVRCCPLAPPQEDVEAPADPEVRWVRDAVAGIIGAPASPPESEVPPPSSLYSWVLSGFGYRQ